MSWTKPISIALALLACQCESAPKSSPMPVTPSTTPPIPQDVRVRMHMAQHFDAITALQTAVVHGRLADARSQAEWLARHPMAAPAAWQADLDAMRDAARQIASARDIAAAGAGLGELGAACASCHIARRANPAFSYDSAPANEASLATQMQRHQWAAARLWEGVLGPKSPQWQDGAAVMANARFDVVATVHAKPNAEVIALGERLREQARFASSITEPAARARFYGEMMTTCASCHTIVRPNPVAEPDRDE